MARVKPVDRMPPNLRLSDNLIDLMRDFSLSSAQAIGGVWKTPLPPSTPFDERYGRWCNHFVPARRSTKMASTSTSMRADELIE